MIQFAIHTNHFFIDQYDIPEDIDRVQRLVAVVVCNSAGSWIEYEKGFGTKRWTTSEHFPSNWITDTVKL